MKHEDGTVAWIGDRVCIRNGDRGVVIASIDTGDYSPEILVRTDAGALVRFAEPLSPGLLWKDI